MILSVAQKWTVNHYFCQGPAGNDTVFEVKFNPNGSVSFQSTVSNVFVGIKDPEMFLEMAWDDPL
jgi:hypothetical protein